MVLGAMVARIGDLGFTPNRAAALGLNLVLLVNLAGTAWLSTRFLTGRSTFHRLERWQTSYLPVFALWAATVVVAFPRSSPSPDGGRCRTPPSIRPAQPAAGTGSSCEPPTTSDKRAGTSASPASSSTRRSDEASALPGGPTTATCRTPCRTVTSTTFANRASAQRSATGCAVVTIAWVRNTW